MGTWVENELCYDERHRSAICPQGEVLMVVKYPLVIFVMPPFLSIHLMGISLWVSAIPSSASYPGFSALEPVSGLVSILKTFIEWTLIERSYMNQCILLSALRMPIWSIFCVVLYRVIFSSVSCLRETHKPFCVLIEMESFLCSWFLDRWLVGQNSMVIVWNEGCGVMAIMIDWHWQGTSLCGSHHYEPMGLSSYCYFQYTSLLTQAQSRTSRRATQWQWCPCEDGVTRIMLCLRIACRLLHLSPGPHEILF